MWVTPAFAQTAGGGGGSELIVSLLPFILIFIIMYFLILRPQRQQQKRREEMLKAIRRGDTVVTNGGLIGKVTKVIDDGEVELQIGRGGQIVRSAGATAQLMAKEGNYATLRLPSGEMRLVHLNCMATIGQVGNLDHQNMVIGKAGRNRWRGIRPHVRGAAMNPVDHPHGGGEGRAPVGLKAPKTKWGKPARGVRTRNNKRTDQFIVRRRGGK